MTPVNRRLLLRLVCGALLATGTVGAVARAQETDPAETGEAAPVVRDLSGTHPKTLALIFDVSGSMKQGGMMKRARKAAISILKNAVGPGDRVALYTFGAGYQKALDLTVRDRNDIIRLLDKVPFEPGDGAGTNIRRPHHEALKIAMDALPAAGIVLLTDSYNDQPGPGDAAYADYVRYYIPGARLDRYPDTSENRDYERLLRRFREGGGKVYGIGIEIDPQTGRPIERSPQSAPDTRPTPEPEPATAQRVREPETSPWPLLLGALGGITVLAGLAVVLRGGKPAPLRVGGGPGGERDFSVRGGAGIRLGGDGAQAALDAYPIPGVREPVALVRGERGQMVLLPQPNATARVFHNGLPLEAKTTLRYGDEVRVSVTDPSADAAPREFRLKFSDPSRDL